MGYTPHVLVVGGDPVGAGIARDFAVRGFDVTLSEPGPIAGGATGRMQGLLAGGARCVEDRPDLARQCLEETRTLFETASHCVEDTGGLVVAGDDRFERLRAACEELGVTTTALSGDEARGREPGLAEGVGRALRVPGGVVDPFQLTHALVRGAREYDAEIRPRTTVTDIHVENGAVEGVTLSHDPLPSTVDSAGDGQGKDTEADRQTRPDGGSKQVPGTVATEHSASESGSDDPSRPEPTVESLSVDYVVNAAGSRAAEVCTRAGLALPVETEQRTTVVTNGHLSEQPVLGGDGVCVVPFGQQTACTASVTEQTRPDAVDSVLERAATLVSTADSRAVRSVERVRHAVPGQVAGGHAFALVDHGDQQDCWGLLTVLGGSVTTHRLVAERVCDDVCQEFGIGRACQTDELVLPGSEDVPDLAEAVGTFGLAESVYEQSRSRLGSHASVVLHSDETNPVVCECQSVSRAEVRNALTEDATADADLEGVRTRTSATMGASQGGRCAHRLAAELSPERPVEVLEGALADTLDGRWEQQRAVAWGRQLREMARNYGRHAATMNRKYESEVDLDGFDSGRPRGTQTPRHCSRAGTGSPFVTDDTPPDDSQASPEWGQQWGWEGE